MSDRRDIPSPSAPNFDDRVREELQTFLGRQGDPLSRALTLRDLVDSGIIRLRYPVRPGMSQLPIEPGVIAEPGPAGPPGPSGPPGTMPDPDLTPPPNVTGLTATPAITHILVEHDDPTYLQGRGHRRTRLYGAIRQPGDPAPTFASAVEVAQFGGRVYAFPTNPNTTWHLWARWESNDGALSSSPAGGTNGVSTTTAPDMTLLIQALTGPGEPFKVITTSTTLPDGSVVPPGTYTADAYIHNGQITNAKIANLAVDDAKIANLSVGKLLAGSIAVGEFIQSTGYIGGLTGWRIDGNGNAEFSNVTVRGTVFASEGQIGGSQITATRIQSNTFTLDGAGWRLNSDGTGQIGGFRVTGTGIESVGFVAGSSGWRLLQNGTFEANTGTFRGAVSGSQFTTGAFTSFAWPAIGQNGTYLGPSGLRIGNLNDGRYFEVLANGNIAAPGFTVVDGVLTINQANVISTLNLQGQAVTIPVSAFTAGSFTGGASFVNAQQVTFNSSGAPIVVFAGVDASFPLPSEGAVTYSFQARVLRNGVQVAVRAYTSQVTINGPGVFPINFFFQDTAGAVAATYVLQVFGPSVTFSNRALFCLETKR